jgi:translation machinery-associated protein 16
MVSSLNKVHKHVTKKKGAKIHALHENSRDAHRLRRAGARDERVMKMTSNRQKQNRPWLDRIAFFQDRLPDTLHPLDLDVIKSLVAEYLSRHDAELEELKNERRPGRPPSNRQLLLQQAMDAERKEYEAGLWLPDLRDEQTLMKLDGWTGEWSALSPFRFVRLNKEGVVKESQFPPRGAS